MENPATWGPLEQTIDKAIRKARENREAGLVGLSEVRLIADAVREAQAEEKRQASYNHFASD
jgi:hypothetical protein